MNGKVLERYAELMIDKIRQMSAGEWQKPWFTPRTGLPQNISGRPYNSMNRLMLYMEMDRMGYTLPVFMTFRQLKDENLMVIKGSHALPVTFYDITVKHKTTGEKISFDDYKSLPELQKQEYKVTPFMKHFYVFNIDQTDFKEKYPERYEGMRGRFSGPAVADNVKGNGNQYDATGILKGLEKAGIDVRNISGSQWESMLRGRGTVLNPAKQKMLFSIRKQPSGYGVRIADISGKISSSVQREL